MNGIKIDRIINVSVSHNRGSVLMSYLCIHIATINDTVSENTNITQNCTYDSLPPLYVRTSDRYINSFIE